MTQYTPLATLSFAILFAAGFQTSCIGLATSSTAGLYEPPPIDPALVKLDERASEALTRLEIFAQTRILVLLVNSTKDREAPSKDKLGKSKCMPTGSIIRGCLRAELPMQ